MNVKLLTKHHLEFLSLTGGSTGLSESTLVKMPHCRKSCVRAHLLFEPKHEKKVLLAYMLCHMGLVATKPVFGVSVKGRLKPVFSATETS